MTYSPHLTLPPRQTHAFFLQGVLFSGETSTAPARNSAKCLPIMTFFREVEYHELDREQELLFTPELSSVTTSLKIFQLNVA